MPHLLLFGHRKVLKTKTNKNWNRHEFLRVCARTLNVPNPTAVESCLCLHKTVWMWSMGDRELPQTRSLGSASHNDWISAPVLTQLKTNTQRCWSSSRPTHSEKRTLVTHIVCSLSSTSHEQSDAPVLLRTRWDLQTFLILIHLPVLYLTHQEFIFKQKSNIRNFRVCKTMTVLFFNLFNLNWSKQKFSK